MKKYQIVQKTISMAGIILLCVFIINIFFVSFYDIVRACGHPIFTYYKWIFTLIVIVDIFPGLFVLPTLFVIFIVQTIQFRKNRPYLRNSAIIIFGAILIFVAGSLIINIVSPIAIELVSSVKMNIYENIVKEVHNKDSKEQHRNLTGGMVGHEDVAFYQYTIEKEIEHTYYVTDFYILYYEDMVCNIEEINKGKGNKGKGMLNMQPKEKSWYWLEATYVPAQ